MKRITVVAYSGVQDRAADTAVKNDLKDMSKLIESSTVASGIYPNDETALSKIGLGATKTPYGTRPGPELRQLSAQPSLACHQAIAQLAYGYTKVAFGKHD